MQNQQYTAVIWGRCILTLPMLSILIKTQDIVMVLFQLGTYLGQHSHGTPEMGG
jgi:hypothetical protein